VASSPAAGQGINFTATTLPGNVVAGTPYYVLATGRTSTTFRFSTSGGVGALAGSAFASTGTSTGSGALNYYTPSLENLTITSLANISGAAEPQLGGAGPTNALGYFTGSNLEATLETAQHGNGIRRIYVRGYRMITDAPGVAGSIIAQENLQTASTTSTEDIVDARGYVWPGLSTRYARAKV